PVPMLFVQGTRDSFAQPDLLAAVTARLGPRAELVSVAGGDHSFRVAGGPREGAVVAAGLAEPAAAFVRRVAAPA
ncbi:MAG: alpha/beta family hydrolase, partial [Gaiellales bacterium]